MKNKHPVTALIIAAVLMAETSVMAAPGSGSSMAVQTEAYGEKQTETITSTVYSKKGWEKRPSGRSYWRMSNGKILKEPGLHKLGGKKYCLNVGGSRVEDAWKKINGKVYYFQKDGVMYHKRGLLKWRGNTFYINGDGSRHSGFRTVKDHVSYFDYKGKMVTNKKRIEIKGRYYNIDSRGYVTRIIGEEEKCMAETRKFIAKHTSPGMSNSQKFRACFNYLVAYLRYHPVPFDPSGFQDKDWPYKIANNVYDSYMSGDCYGFACCVAACARELGYDPYVVITTGDHAFVMIDGLYYDNMGPLFGASSHFAYNTLHKVKF